MQEENEVQQVAVPVEEKVKVQSTEEGKIFIDPMDLFSLERVREIINRVNEINVIKGSKSLT